MKEEIIYIHNMLGPRDILSVSKELERVGMQVKKVDLGTAAFVNPSSLPAEELAKVLSQAGYRVLLKKEKVFIDQVKNVMSIYLDKHNVNTQLPLISEFLEDHLLLSYSTISKKFSRIEGRSIENYYISLKVSRIKQLLQHSDMSIKDIAMRLNYRSPSSLARIFKEVTGVSVSSYKQGARLGPYMSSGQ